MIWLFVDVECAPWRLMDTAFGINFPNNEQASLRQVNKLTQFFFNALTSLVMVLNMLYK